MLYKRIDIEVIGAVFFFNKNGIQGILVHFLQLSGKGRGVCPENR